MDKKPSKVVLNIYNHQRTGIETQYKKEPVSRLLISTECYYFFFFKYLPLITVYFAKKADCSPGGRKESDTTEQQSMHMNKSRHRISVPLWHLRMSCFAFLWAFPCPFSFPHLDNSCSSFGSHLRFHFLSAASPVWPSLGETSFLTLPPQPPLLTCISVRKQTYT